MQSNFSIAVYIITILLVSISFCLNKRKTLCALMKAWKMFFSILPQFISILLIMGMLLSFVKPEMIKSVIGSDSGILGIIASSLLGAITLIPVIIVFPIAAELYKNGAGLVPITIFISTLTTVGIITIPIEKKFLGGKIAILRNACFFISAFFVAAIVKLVLS